MENGEYYFVFDNFKDRMLLNFTGILLMVYSYYIEQQKERCPTYTSYCDFSQRFACTSRVLTSRYSRGLGLMPEGSVFNIRNCVTGLAFHTLQILIGYLAGHSPACRSFLLYSSVVSSVACLYLARILFFVLSDACVVCISVYVINAALLYLNYHI